ncbi:hypothetical protein P025_gp38 [Pelagibacter phage HTVC025P]|jgi:hypothetical protein|uniref:Uncharacterized protein n=1 Tax=Pelagibacter phage HTVC025P TaxID=2259657 RepID=A0A4Y1NU62_9CAUD|nr:hypothetical protein P025_gp38 [Pelagibacter phage HTVC025P]
MARKRETPVLNLPPDLPQVVSQDFNLFYKPEPEPVDKSVQLFAKSLENFVNDAGSKLVISAEQTLKKEEGAKAQQDYLENKLKFRDAVKDGKIDKTANPYYIEKYKELTLNDYANKFIDRLGKNYQKNGVVKDTRDGSFQQFYKSELEQYIKENELGFFGGIELEKGFFKETSSYRAILENNHRQAQLKEFEKNFNEKVESRVYGILEKFKDFDGSVLGDFEDGVSKWKFLADKIQKEMSSLNDIGADDITDRILSSLEKYVKTTRDFDYAKQIISNLPEFLSGGTGSFGDIGKVKMKQEELLTLLMQSQEQKESNEVKLRENKDKKDFVKTYDFLNQNKDNTDFNIFDYRNSSERTPAELKAVDTFIKDQKFDGGNSDNPSVMNDIFKLIEEGKYEEAENFARKNMYSGAVRKSTYNTLITSDIPNARNYKEMPVFGNEIYQATIGGLNSVISSNANYGNKLEAGLAKGYINKKMLRWYKENSSDPKYRSADGSFKDEAFENDFLKYFNNIVEVMKTAQKPNGEYVFKSLQFNETSSFNETENILDKKLNTPQIPK